MERKIECKFCKFKGITKSERMYVTCPNCLRKIKPVITATQALKNFSGISG